MITELPYLILQLKKHIILENKTFFPLRWRGGCLILINLISFHLYQFEIIITCRKIKVSFKQLYYIYFIQNKYHWNCILIPFIWKWFNLHWISFKVFVTYLFNLQSFVINIFNIWMYFKTAYKYIHIKTPLNAVSVLCGSIGIH